MRPRVLIAGEKFRLVRTRTDTVWPERVDGRDAMNRMRWVNLPVPEVTGILGELVEDLGTALVRRENLARKARREGSGA